MRRRDPVRRMVMVSAVLFAAWDGSTGRDVQDIRLKPEEGGLNVKVLEKPNALETVFPINSTGGKSFTASLRLDVRAWDHYGCISVGFRDSIPDDLFEALLSKGDDGLRTVSMNVVVAGGSEYRSTLCHIPPEMKFFNLTYKCDTRLNKYKLIVAGADNKTLRESDWQKIRGYFTVSQFFIRAAAGKKGLEPGSSISWDERAKAIRAVSHVGNERGYRYLIDASISRATIETE